MKVLVLGLRAPVTRRGVLPDAEVLGSLARVEQVTVLEDEPDRSSEPSRLVPGAWAGGLDRAGDLVLERLLPRARYDVVVTLDRPSMAAAVQLCPDRVRVVHRERLGAAGPPEPLTAYAGRCDALVADGGTAAGRVREAARIPVDVVPPGVRPVTTASADRSPVVLLPQGSGGVEPVEHALRSLALVAPVLSGWTVHVAARPGAQDRLAALVEELGLHGLVELGGAAADWAGVRVGVLVSDAPEDRFAAVLAGSAGVPVVAVDRPGAVDVVRHGRTGLRVPPRSVAALAAAVAELVVDGRQRDGLGRSARDEAPRFAPEIVAEQWRAVLGRVRRAGGRSSRPVRTAAAGFPGEHGKPAPPPAPAGQLTDLVRVAGELDPGWFAVPPRRPTDPVVLALSGAVRRDLRPALAAAGLGVEGDPAEDPLSLVRVVLADGAVAEVELWDPVAGARHARRTNRFATVVPDGAERGEAVIAGVRLPTVALMTRRTFEDRPFPVDVVYTWVDGADPAWRERRDHRAAEVGETDRTAAGDARYLNRDELRYSMRSLHRFAPWVRRIHLVTDGQRPPWLADDDRVVVVDHTAILPADALPTYNSHAIETALHRIDGLSDCFVYLNDDVFLADHLDAADLFTAAGQPLVFLSPGLVGLPTDDAPRYLAAARTNRRLVEDEFGLTPTHTLLHTPYPLRRSLLEDVVARFPDDVRRTAATPFRSPTDVSMTSSLAQHVGLATGAAQVGHLTYRYVGLGSGRLGRELARLRRDREVQAFCLGDAHHLPLGAPRVASLVRDFLEAAYPEPAPWERPA